MDPLILVIAQLGVLLTEAKAMRRDFRERHLPVDAAAAAIREAAIRDCIAIVQFHLRTPHAS